MHNTLNTKKFLLACLLAVPSLALAQSRAALGPVEALGKASSTITVLGQTFAISGATRIAVNGVRISTGEIRQSIATGQSVYVEGIDVPGRSLATSIDVIQDPYVAGATVVHILGKVSEYSPSSGSIRIGSLRIDSSAVDPELVGRLQIGSAIHVSGIQPSPRGALVGPIQLSIGGSGMMLESIGGSGAQIQSIGGSGTLSIGGSGAKLESIGGSGTLSIGGSGAQVQSIGGSGKLTSGAQIQSIGGSGTLSIGGSGKQVQSIGGSGNQIQSIGGSGAQTQSIGGSGLQ
jgi:hypothetical protein